MNFIKIAVENVCQYDMPSPNTFKTCLRMVSADGFCISETLFINKNPCMDAFNCKRSHGADPSAAYRYLYIHDDHLQRRRHDPPCNVLSRIGVVVMVVSPFLSVSVYIHKAFHGVPLVPPHASSYCRRDLVEACFRRRLSPLLPSAAEAAGRGALRHQRATSGASPSRPLARVCLCCESPYPIETHVLPFVSYRQ